MRSTLLVVVTLLAPACAFTDGSPSDPTMGGGSGSGSGGGSGSGSGSSLPMACHSTLPGVALCLDFEDPSLDPTIQDASASHENAVSNDVVAMTRDSQIGVQQAAAIGDTSTIGLLAPSALELSTQVSVEAWLRLSTEPGGSAWVYPFVFDNQYDIAVSAQGVSCEIYDPSGNDHWAFMQTPLPTDTWTHIACVFDGMTITTYVDGNVGSCYSPPGPGIATHASLGAEIGLGVDGGVDDVHVYDRALAPGEVCGLATGGSACNTQCQDPSTG